MRLVPPPTLVTWRRSALHIFMVAGAGLATLSDPGHATNEFQVHSFERNSIGAYESHVSPMPPATIEGCFTNYSGTSCYEGWALAGRALAWSRADATRPQGSIFPGMRTLASEEFEVTFTCLGTTQDISVRMNLTVDAQGSAVSSGTAPTAELKVRTLGLELGRWNLPNGTSFSTGIFEGLTGTSLSLDFQSQQVSVPLNSPRTMSFSLETYAQAVSAGDHALMDALAGGLRFRSGGAAFELPDGCTCNSTTANIVDNVWMGDGTTAVSDPVGSPFSLAIAPNPFVASAVMRIRLSRGGPAWLDVYDVSGRHVARLAGGNLAAGEHEVRWDGRDQSGRPVGAGVYLARLSGHGSAVTRRIARVR